MNAGIKSDTAKLGFIKLGFIWGITSMLLAACGGGSSGGGSGSESDPLVEAYPIAYVKRPIPRDDQQNVSFPDPRDPIAFNAGADLYLRDYASPSAAETNLTETILMGMGDVKDVEVSYDGTRLLFAMRLPDIPNAQPAEQPTWNIWEYNIPENSLRRIIKVDDFAREGQDVAPNYLPDGRIIFSSTRQHRSKEILSDEGKPVYRALVESQNEEHAMMLHVMNSDGTEIKQLTFSPRRDLDSVVLPNGRILFTRWDRDRRNTNEINIYSIKPDGTDLQLIYGSNSHDTGTDNSTVQFTQPRIFHDGSLLTILRPYTGTQGGGDLVLIDTAYYVDNDRPNKDNQGIPGTAQTSLSQGTISTLPGPSAGGRFASIYPLADGTKRSLVSWSQCRYLDGGTVRSCANQVPPQNAQAAEPFYGLFILDHTEGTSATIIPPREGIMISDVVVTQDRAYPEVLVDNEKTDGSGYLHIRSVYDFDGAFRPDIVESRSPLSATVRIPNISCDDIPNTSINNITLDERAPQNPQEMADYGVIENSSARFLRLVRPLIMPDRGDLSRNNQIPNFASGPRPSTDGYSEIIGYAPIEPDGSVKVKVPADTPFSFQITDAKGRRLNIPNAQDNTAPRHFVWLQVRDGETLECNGCHQRGNQVSHGTQKATASVNPGASSSRNYACMETNMVANYQETMAETRTRICADGSCAGVKPTLDLIYDDIWTRDISSLDVPPDEPSTSVFAKAAPIELLYDNVYSFNTDPLPFRPDCVANWKPDCRVEINYVQHIAPLWEKVRNDTNTPIPNPTTCAQNGCHSPLALDGTTQIPKPENGSQLNFSNASIEVERLSRDPVNSRDETNHLKSYRELFVRDNRQVLFPDNDMAPLVDETITVTVPDIDPDTDEQRTDPVTGDLLFREETRPVQTTVAQPMSSSGALASSRFFDEMENDSPIIEAGNEFDHSGLLSPSDLKLISEWLDSGGQYYSNPFSIP